MQTDEQQYARALADRLEARAERYETAVRSADRRVGGRPYHGDDWRRTRAVGLSSYYARQAGRLRDAARVVREEVDRGEASSGQRREGRALIHTTDESEEP